MDLSKAIVGLSMSHRMTRDIVLKALVMAISARRPDFGLLHHSDRGSQYASGDLQELLDEHGIECSMSGVRNCYDNAVVESWFGLLKREWANRRRYATHQVARQGVFDYIERFYNRRRPHGAVGRMSPLEYEEKTLDQTAH